MDEKKEETAKEVDEQKEEETTQEAVEQKENIQQPELTDLEDENKGMSARDIEFLLDIPVDISVELGTKKMLIKDLLQLGNGSVVELEKLAGEPMDIYANNRLIARGEAVVVNEKFAVRLTDVISPTDRLSQLK
jgi:flagellar motor switch protein FliN/FliY